MIYQGSVRPGSDRLTNRIDIFNEMQVMICTQTIIIFTDWVGPDVQFSMGWYWIGILLATALINLLIIFYLSFYSLLILLKKYWLRLKRKLDAIYLEYRKHRACTLNKSLE